MKKKFLITLITVCTILFAFGMINASAETVADGECGDNLTWTLDDKGELVISGSGDMFSYGDFNKSPWHENYNITNVKIGENVTSIGKSAFYGCSSIINVTIPSSVTSIEQSAFSGCEGITRVNITDIKAWCGIDFANVEHYEYANPLYFSGKLYLNGSLITELVIPDGVTEIKDYAFFNCNSISNVIIPNSVKSIGDYAFSRCRNLENVIISEGVVNIGYAAFRNCMFTNLIIPDSVEIIGNYAFEGCYSLTSITFGQGVKQICGGAFQASENIKKVNVEDLIVWSKIQFGDSTSSNPLRYAKNLYLNDVLVKNVVISDDVKDIGNRAFYCCESVESVSVGNGIKTIPDYYFYGCVNLKYVGLPVGISYIRNDAFNGCSNIETVFYEGDEAQWNEILFYNRNENLTNAKVVYNATKKTYKFETNCDNALDDVTDYAIFTMPTVQNDGMTLTGWYDNEALSGESVTFPYYGDATTLYAAWTDRTGKTFDDAFIAKANQEYTVTTTESGQLVYFEFVPRLSKEYRFYTTGSKDTYGYLYNSNKSQLTSNDDAGDGNNFYITYTLTAGQTYYIAAKLYSGTGTFAFVVEEPVDYRINEITIKDMSGNSLQAIPTGTFLATVSFTNVSSSEDTVIVLAQYTDVGAFTGLMYIQTEDVPTGSTIKLSIPVDNSNGDVAKLKAFCWESFASLTPMGNSASFPAE